MSIVFITWRFDFTFTENKRHTQVFETNLTQLRPIINFCHITNLVLKDHAEPTKSTLF